MAKFSCDISGIDDSTLGFMGYQFDEENDEFKVYRDKFGEPHIVQKSTPRLFVEDINDAVFFASKTNIVALPDDI